MYSVGDEVVVMVENFTNRGHALAGYVDVSQLRATTGEYFYVNSEEEFEDGELVVLKCVALDDCSVPCAVWEIVDE